MAVLYADARLGGRIRWVYGDPRSASVRVPDELKDCVCYVCTKKGGKFYCGGTAFFVSVASGVPKTASHTYLVTARHCLKQIEELGTGVYLRINTADDKAEYLQLESEWYYPEVAPGADVAVLPFSLPEEAFYYKYVPDDMIVMEKVIAQHGIGVGSDVLVTGLFTLRTGTQKNYPIVRAGIIASMLDEPLQDAETGKPYEAYLIEIRSIGGLSGSPVFVYFPVDGPGPTKHNVYLLGLIRGHWNINAPPTLQPTFASDGEAVNVGIAIVTPAEEILKILQYEELVKMRRAADRKLAQKTAPTLD